VAGHGGGIEDEPDADDECGDDYDDRRGASIEHLDRRNL
jgi:hypothetical protein